MHCIPYATCFPALARFSSRGPLPVNGSNCLHCHTEASCVTPSSAKPKTSFSCSFNLLWLLAYYTTSLKSRESSVGIATGCTAEVPFSVASRPALGRTQPPIQMRTGVLSPGLTTRLHLMLRSWMVELYLHSPICLHGTASKKINKI
jgi:hypothetical protein